MDPYIGEIRMFAGTFAPAGWALCNGQTLQITQNTPLFGVIGNIYGGNGTTTFALPNLGGRVIIHTNETAQPGLSTYTLGQQGGVDTVTLQPGQLAAHGHGLNVADSRGDRGPGADAVLTTPRIGGIQDTKAGTMFCDSAPGVVMTAPVMNSVGGGQAHNNIMPYLAVNYIIALQGVFPPHG